MPAIFRNFNLLSAFYGSGGQYRDLIFRKTNENEQEKFAGMAKPGGIGSPLSFLAGVRQPIGCMFTEI